MAKGVWKLHLMVRRSNASVRRFYEALGFSEDEVTMLSKRMKPMPLITPTHPNRCPKSISRA